jgi:hypothetical protein
MSGVTNVAAPYDTDTALDAAGDCPNAAALADKANPTAIAAPRHLAPAAVNIRVATNLTIPSNN